MPAVKSSDNRPMCAGLVPLLTLGLLGAIAPQPSSAPLLGLAVNMPAGGPAADGVAALEEVRRTGVSLFVLTLSWSEAEPAPRRYRVDDFVRSARLLRQSGAALHLDVPLVTARSRDVPRDLSAIAFDDPRLSLRLGRLLDALGPALLDFSTLSLGQEADLYFADKPAELNAYRRLFDGAVQFLEKKWPSLRVGVTTMAPTESPAPLVAAALHQRSPILFYVYAPFARGRPFQHRAPSVLEADWRLLLKAAGQRPIAFPEVSFSSAPENASSPTMQAEFVRRLRRYLSESDGRRLLFARYVVWRDPTPEELTLMASEGEDPRLKAFLAHRGLQTEKGQPKPAWREWLRAARSRIRSADE